MKWAEKPKWTAVQAEVFNSHLKPVSTAMGISQDELGLSIDDAGYGAPVYGVLFELFLSHRTEPDGANVVDDYLKRRGWRESPVGRRYLQQLRDSVLSLYEVVDITPGQHCDVRDLVRGGSTIRVHEKSATEAMVKWDRLAARVVVTNRKYKFSGGILPFPHDAASSLLDLLTKAKRRFKKDFAAAGHGKVPESDAFDTLFLTTTSLAFISVWLTHVFDRLHAPPPELVNRDGEVLTMVETRFPVSTADEETIAKRLDAASDWEREDAAGHRWLWLPGHENPDSADAEAVVTEDSSPGIPQIICGTAELKASKSLTFSTNSAERAERGNNRLDELLGDLIGQPMSGIQTPEQAMAEHQSAGRGAIQPNSEIDPAVTAEFIHQMLDQHYRKCLDEPIPALGNKSPRQCARSSSGRKKVIGWLKELENSESRRAAKEGTKPYDSAWMWDELGLEKDV